MAKTIFNTSEKSNFILNMTEEQFSKLASIGLAIAIMMPTLFTLIPEIVYEVKGEGSYVISAGGLVLGGVIAMIVTIIGVMKKYISKWSLFPVCAMGAMVLWGVVSLVRGCFLSISFYGYSNRGEGLLAIIFYFCFFTAAACLKRETAIRTVINGVVGVGILNGIISLVQVFAGSLSHYINIPTDLTVNAASGLSMSPLFLAMVLTLSLTAALIGFITSDNKKLRIAYICSAALFSFIMMFTYTLIGWCGLVLAVIISVMSVFMLNAPKKRLLCVPVSLAAAAASVALVCAGAIGNISSYKLYDGKLLWWADAYRRASASGTYDPNVVDIDDTIDVYAYLNRRTLKIISNNALSGTGPDQMVFATLNPDAEYSSDMTIEDGVTSLDNTGSFDKVYNEYLYTAATRGIPSLIALVITFMATLILGLKSFGRRKTVEAFTVYILAAAGMLIYFIGCSSIIFAPVFWTVAGAACANIVTDKEKKAEKKLAKKK